MWVQWAPSGVLILVMDQENARNVGLSIQRVHRTHDASYTQSVASSTWNTQY